jgi:methylated-DNA-protein-cysteine methyltransferase-like protein
VKHCTGGFGLKNFNEKVYALVNRIPVGKVLTYSRIARLLNVPRGARAVGWALRALPANSTVPWQRVINAEGRISIHMAAHNAFEQQERLEAEGVYFDKTGKVKLEGPGGKLWPISPLEAETILAEVDSQLRDGEVLD